MPANPTPAEGVVAPLDPDFAEALIEKLTEIATRDDLKGRHVVFNTEVRSIATIVGVAAKVIGRPLAARPAAPTQSATQTGHLHTAVMDALRSEIMRQNPRACSEETEGDMILPVAVPAGSECAYAPLDLSALAEAVLPALSKLEPGR